ncbi:MAG: universal stress protein [Myxococcales bacterium]|nr:universal stress protein [Myxococcales bacterium]MCA9568166.1 universal stress protein [Myxococcales bacterium]MCB9671821.1 universal stress protein [Alphaproteobacteria bacterium]
MRILLACDLNDANTEDLITRATGWAERLGGKIDLLFVDAFPYAAAHVHDPTAQILLTQEYDKLRDSQIGRLDAMLASIPEASRGAVRRSTGARPEDLIIEAAEGYDLVMVGTHGRTGLAGFFVGSVAERVVRRSPVATLVLRA